VCNRFSLTTKHAAKIGDLLSLSQIIPRQQLVISKQPKEDMNPRLDFDSPHHRDMHMHNPSKLRITYKELIEYTPLESNFQITASSSALRCKDSAILLKSYHLCIIF
jgi:hypothetical protein